jgi:hypothetical protein
MRLLCMVLSAAILSGCSGLPGASPDQKLNPLGSTGLIAHPYDGLNKASYGAFTQAPLSYCGEYGGDPLYGALLDVGHDLIGKLYDPVGGAMVYDDTLVKEDLQDQFRKTGDIGNADVVVLQRDDKGISFWYSMDAVSADEVANAAKKYCGRLRKPLLFQGAARQCGQPIDVSSKKGPGQTVIPTYAIAAFSCGSINAPSQKH